MAAERKLEDWSCRTAKEKGCEHIKLTDSAKNGLPDDLFLTPNGRVFFVEFKAPRGRAAALQDWWYERLIRMGFSVYRNVKTKERFASILAQMLD